MLKSEPDVGLRARVTPDVVVAVTAMTAALVMALGLFRSQKLVVHSADPYEFGKIARGFVEHGFTTLTRRAASLYPEAIAVVYRLGGSDFTVLLLQCVLHVGTCLLVFSLGKRLFNARTGFLAGVVCALHPMLLRYVSDLFSETMLTFMSMAVVWCAVNFYQHPRVRNAALLGAVGMIATLTKGVMLPVVLALGGACLVSMLRRGQTRQAIGAGVAMAVSMAVLLAPWTYRNYKVTGGRFVLLTPGASDSFLRGYIFTRWEFATLQKPPYEIAETESNEWFRQIAKDAGTKWEADEVVDEVNNARVVRYMIANYPFDTIRKIVVGLFTFWYEMTSWLNSLIAGGLALGGWVLAVIGLKRCRREGQPAWLIWLPIVTMNVFVALLIPLGRYSVPVVPCLMILAAFGADTLLRGRAVSRTALEAGTA